MQAGDLQFKRLNNSEEPGTFTLELCYLLIFSCTLITARLVCRLFISVCCTPGIMTYPSLAPTGLGVGCRSTAFLLSASQGSLLN